VIDLVEVAPAVVLGGPRLVLIAGPCVIESEGHAVDLAHRIAAVAAARHVPLVFKASFDKANRTSLDSYRGPGLEAGLKVLDRVRREVGCPVTTDVHEVAQVRPAATVVDLLQIPAFLCRQTDLLLAAGDSGRAVNIKKGPFLDPANMTHAVAKIRSTGNRRVAVTERGASFGYGNLVVDMRSLVVLREGCRCPVVMDGTHSVQLPGAGDGRSGGDRRFIRPLCRAAAAVGIDALFLEVHEAPERALSDGPNALPLDQLGGLLDELQALHALGRVAAS
jgi:2-dehydro-3-deoxyphosphooctonate aldolase (KDO 8-P synthase)